MAWALPPTSTKALRERRVSRHAGAPKSSFSLPRLFFNGQLRDGVLDHVAQSLLDEPRREVEGQPIDFHTVAKDEIGRVAAGVERFQARVVFCRVDFDEAGAAAELFC